MQQQRAVFWTVAIVLGTVWGCQETVAPSEPSLSVVAEASTLAGSAPLHVHFSVKTRELLASVVWDFGDGSPSERGFTPEHTFVEPGDYTVRVTVVEGALSTTKTLHIHAAEALVWADVEEPDRNMPSAVAERRTLQAAIISKNARGLEPLLTELQCHAIEGTGQKPFAYAWAFENEDEAPQKRIASVVREYITSGVFQATCTITDSAGEQSSAITVVEVGAAQAPKVRADARVVEGEAPLRTLFTCAVEEGTGNAPLTYKWDFGDGHTSLQQNPVHIYEEEGDFEATCRVTGAFGLMGRSVVSIVVQGNASPRVSSVWVSGRTTFEGTSHCAAVGQTIPLSVDVFDPDGDELYFIWRFTASPNSLSPRFSDPFAPSPSFEAEKVGVYSVRVEVTDTHGHTTIQETTINVEGPSLIRRVNVLEFAQGVAGERYPLPLIVSVETACGLPVPQPQIEWSADGGTIERSDAAGNVSEATVALGCDVERDSMFTAAWPEFGLSATTRIEAREGASSNIELVYADDVPLHDTAGEPAAMRVDLALQDRCGNPTHDEVEVVLTALEGACFDGWCNEGGTRTQNKMLSGTTSVDLYSNRLGEVGVDVTGFGGEVREGLRGRFVPGAPYYTSVNILRGGVGGCASSPGFVGLSAFDRFGHATTSGRLQVRTRAEQGQPRLFAPLDTMLSADPLGSVAIGLNALGQAQIWVDHTAEGTVLLEPLLPGQQAPITVHFVEQSDERSELLTCSDGLDNDCNGWSDCEEGMCGDEPQCGPDLFVTLQPATLAAGVLTTTVAYGNAGLAVVGGCAVVRLHLTPEGADAPVEPFADDPYLIGEPLELCEFSARDLLSERIEVPLPSELDGAMLSGTYALRASIAWVWAVNDINTTNHTSDAQQIEVSPDLSVALYALEDNDGSLNVHGAAFNQGTAGVQPSHCIDLVLFVAVEMTAPGEPIELLRLCDGVLPGEELPFVLDLSREMLADIPPGDHMIYAFVDYNDTFVEEDEENNLSPWPLRWVRR